MASEIVSLKAEPDIDSTKRKSDMHFFGLQVKVLP